MEQNPYNKVMEQKCFLLKAPAKAVKLPQAFTLGFVLCQITDDFTNLNYETRGK